MSLHEAIRKDLYTLRSLLESGENVDFKDEMGQTPIVLAIKVMNLECFYILLEFSANINICDNNMNTPLHIAVQNIGIYGKIMWKIIKTLLTKGADVNVLNKSGQSPLNAFVTSMKRYVSFSDRAIVKLFLQLKIDVNNKSNRDAFHYVIINLDVDVLKEFLNAGFRITAEDIGNISLLHNASKKGYIQQYQYIVEDLLKFGADVNSKYENSLFLHTVIDKSIPKVSFLEMILKCGADVKNSLLYTRKTFIVQNDIIELLINYGADVNAVDNENKTLLHCTRQPHIARILLDHGANVDSVDYEGKTPLHCAKHPDIVKILVEHGAKVDAVDNKGKTPLFYALDEMDVLFPPDIWKLLYFEDKPKDIEKTKIIKALIKYGANVNLIEYKDPLHIAIKDCNDIQLVRLLLKCNVNVNRKNKNDETPLHFAAKKKSKKKFIYPLLRYGANVNCKDNTGSTPLHYAVKYNNHDEIVALLQFNAELDCKNNLGKKPWDNSTFSPLEYDKKILGSLISYGCIYDVNLIPEETYQRLSRIRQLHLFPQSFKNFIYYLIAIYYTGSCLNSIVRKFLKEIFKNLESVTAPYASECKQEIEKLKFENIDEINISYFDFIKLKNFQLEKYVRHKRILEILNSNTLKNSFPIYAKVIKVQCNKLIKKLKLLDENIQLLSSTFDEFSRLPDLCIEKILKYLDNDDLINIANLDSFNCAIQLIGSTSGGAQ